MTAYPEVILFMCDRHPYKLGRLHRARIPSAETTDIPVNSAEPLGLLRHAPFQTRKTSRKAQSGCTSNVLQGGADVLARC